MGYGDFYGWICGCGAKVKAKNGALPDDWRIVWPDSKGERFNTVDAVPPPGIYCGTCWGKLPGEQHTARIDTDGKPYRAAIIGNVGEQYRLASAIQLRTSERLALGRRYEDIMGENHEGLRELIGAGLHQRCFPSGAPPDIPGIAMVIHPSAMASGIHGTLYEYFQALAARYDEEVHLFWDETRWHLVFIGDYSDYNTGKCEFWMAFYPDGTSELMGAS